MHACQYELYRLRLSEVRALRRDRQTDTTECITTPQAPVLVNIQILRSSNQKSNPRKIPLEGQNAAKNQKLPTVSKGYQKLDMYIAIPLR